MESHYEALGLTPDADERTVRQAYRALLKDHHPDHGGSREQFLRIKEAYEQILDERVPDNCETDGGAIADDGSNSHGPRRPTYDPADRSNRNGDHELTVDGEYLSVTLSGLVHDVDLDALVDGPVTAATRRTVAFFRVRNTSEQILSWQGKTNTNFIGDDGFLYEGSSIVAPHATDLPERWIGSDAELEPERALDGVVIAQEIPDDVTVEQVIYTQHAPDVDAPNPAATERYLFELKPLIRERLDRFPFERS
ncbi:J domain-containing protein [Natrinema halophilum]|uniref:J domain-containing protein n=1 Tax=Natrinema halophilum TaxID=1699371 RepID=A0A7D5GPU0_9EURY|nr:J domain-containing protein [Natrinema halophilum]QLG50773.1 J domain-containing protein [Natrinema halophilum]